MSPLTRKPAPAASGCSERRDAGEQRDSTLSLSCAPDNNVAPSLGSNRRARRAARSGATELARLSADAAANAEDELDTLIVTRTVRQLRDMLRGSLVPPPPPREVLDTPEAADLLRVSMSTLWRLVRDGLVRPRVIGGSRRYLRSELIEAVRNAPVAEVTRG